MRTQRNFLLDGLILGVALSLGNSSIPANPEAPSPPETDASQTLSFEELRNFTEIFGRIKQDYVVPVSDKQLFDDAIQGMLTNLDPHSAYMASDEYQEFQKATTGQFVGLGLEIGMENGVVKVISPIDDTPAQKAGIKAGDLIVEFDGKPVDGMTKAEAAKFLHGELGAKIVLTIARAGEKAPLTFALTRGVIKSQSVKYRLLQKNYGYLRIGSFQSDAGQALLKAVERLNKQNAGPLNGLVLDLRDNPGGVVKEAVEVCDAFLDAGLIVRTEGRIKNAEMRIYANPDDVMHGAPIVVLIDAGSASAAEIVAGALQDNKRAIIMGEKSFGKGSVQTVMPLDNGAAIRLTIARYFTPSGRSIQAKGIEPDIALAPVKLESLNQARFDSVKEADLNRHFPDKDDKPVKKSAAENHETPGVAEDGGDKVTRDYALNEALNLLKGLGAMTHITPSGKM